VIISAYEELEAKMKTATVEQKRRMASMPRLRSGGPSLTHEQVRQLVKQPTQSLLYPEIGSLTPLFAGLDCYIVETDDEVGFITSDHPCVWYDPEGYKRPPLYRAPALTYPSIEITFPVSPRQCILLNRAGITGYGKTLNSNPVKELNRRTRFHTGEHFVVSKNWTDPIWFEAGELPDDASENLHCDGQ
jgi:hypothetical protein